MAVTAKAYGSDSNVPMQVSLVDAKGNTLASQSFTLTAGDIVYTAVLKGNASANNKVRIENTTTGKRVLLKQVKVYSGNDASKAPVETGDTATRTVTGITGTSYTVTSLASGAVYDYKVKAVYAGGESGWSNVIRTHLPSGTTLLPGDADGNGRVDITDVTTLINKILGHEPSPFVEANADVDGNGRYDVSDVTGINVIILQQQ